MIGDILQPTHLLLILIVALVVLGPKRLPEVGRAVGRSLHDFRGAINGEHPHEREHLDEPQPAMGAEPTPPVTVSAEPTPPVTVSAEPTPPVTSSAEPTKPVSEPADHVA